MIIAMFGLIVNSSWAQKIAPNEDENILLQLEYPLAQLSHDLKDELIQEKDESKLSENRVIADQNDKKSVLQATLFSAVIPGSGQFYNNSYVKGLAFLGFEITAWILNATYKSSGNNLTEKFEKFADEHWSADEYWASIDDAIERDKANGEFDCGGKTPEECSRSDYEAANFSHFLPDTKNQTYYENIGKYGQFNAGWDDTDKIEVRDSKNGLNYVNQRIKANDKFDMATLFSSLALLNHVLSAFDAGYSSYRYNKSQVQTKLTMTIQRYNSENLPTLSLDVTW